MDLPITLQDKIVRFLKSLPNISDTKGRQAFIYTTGIDPQLCDYIPFDEPPARFIPLLVSMLVDYGELNDGRDALESVLKTAKNYIGQDKQVYCDKLLQEYQKYIEEQTDFNSDTIKEIHTSKKSPYLKEGNAIQRILVEDQAKVNNIRQRLSKTGTQKIVIKSSQVSDINQEQ